MGRDGDIACGNLALLFVPIAEVRVKATDEVKPIFPKSVVEDGLDDGPAQQPGDGRGRQLGVKRRVSS